MLYLLVFIGCEPFVCLARGSDCSTEVTAATEELSTVPFGSDLVLDTTAEVDLILGSHGL